MYKLAYLPSAKQDMAEIAGYISHELSNPAAAEKLAAEMIEAAGRLTKFPYANGVHFSLKPLRQEYRKLAVRSYMMFYWIDEAEKLVTVARVIYASRDFEKLL
jgi:plasmid stabilization system protein ParE